MNAPFFNQHWLDASGMPAGGVSTGRGFTISWQNGPMQVEENRNIQNGAFVESIIDAAKKRIEFYQSTQFACTNNAEAIMYLEDALRCLDNRTKDREARGVEGTHKE